MKLEKVKSHWNERWLRLQTELPTRTGNYYISDYGRIKVVNKLTGSEKLLNGSISKRGFKKLNIRMEGNKAYSIHVHKFVAENFVEKDDDQKEFLTHLDGNKLNNHWNNLQWLTRDELTAWQKKNGIISIEKTRKALKIKMTESKVKMLKKRLKEGKTKKKILAKMYGITMTQLKRIESGENWGYVKVEEDDLEKKSIKIEV